MLENGDETASQLVLENQRLRRTLQRVQAKLDRVCTQLDTSFGTFGDACADQPTPQEETP